MHAAAARGRPGRLPDPLRRLRAGPLRAGARRAGRLAGVPVRRRRRACRTSATRSPGARPACCWRPTRPGTTPRAGCCTKMLGPAALRRLRERWIADAEELVDEVLADGRRVRRRPARWPRRSRCGCSRTRSACRRRAGRTCCPTATTRSTPSARRNDLVAKGAPRVAELSAWVGRAVRRATCWPRRDSAPTSGPPSDRGRHHPRAGAADRPLAAHRRRRHHRARHLRRPLRLRDQPRPVAAAARASPSLARVAFDEAVRWESPVQTFFRTATTDVRVGEHVVPDGTKILMFLGAANRDPRRWARPGPLRPRPATRRATSASAWASTSASASTSPGWRRKPCSPRWPAGSHASSSPGRPGGTTTTRCGPGSRSR